MADPIAMSQDGLIEERPSSSTARNDKPQEMDVDSPADVPRTKLQIAAILVALNVCHWIFIFISLEDNYTDYFKKLALFVAALDQTIVSTALPTIASELHSASGYTWVGSAYLLANAAAAPIWFVPWSPHNILY
jgi:hypothetical protein